MERDELISAFEAGEDMDEYFDFDQAVRPNRTKKVNVDFTVRMVEELDAEAAYLGINRQAVIKSLCDEGLTRRQRLRAGASVPA